MQLALSRSPVTEIFSSFFSSLSLLFLFSFSSLLFPSCCFISCLHHFTRDKEHAVVESQALERGPQGKESPRTAKKKRKRSPSLAAAVLFRSSSSSLSPSRGHGRPRRSRSRTRPRRWSSSSSPCPAAPAPRREFQCRWIVVGRIGGVRRGPETCQLAIDEKGKERKKMQGFFHLRSSRFLLPLFSRTRRLQPHFNNPSTGDSDPEQDIERRGKRRHRQRRDWRANWLGDRASSATTDRLFFFFCDLLRCHHHRHQQQRSSSSEVAAATAAVRISHE